MIGTCDRRGRGASGRRLGRDRRAAIALIAALAAPALLLSVAMGIEVAHWSVLQTETQRIADMAALAGAESYGGGATAEQAAVAAANVAEINGATGTSDREWTAGSQSLSDNEVTVQLTKGVNNPDDPAVRATVSVPVPLLFLHLWTGAQAITIHATALAEVGSIANNVQPCVLTLKGDAQGVQVPSGITVTGNTDASMTGCSLVSDGNISMSGNLTLDVSGLYSGGTISMSGNVSGTGTNTANWHQASPQVSDPYASNTTLQSAIAQASCTSPQSPAYSSSNMTYTLYPNVCYGPISISGNAAVVFSGTGLYTVNGPITISGNTTVGGTTISGSGITVVSTGPISISGNFNSGAVTLTAPKAGTASDGAIAGVLFATDSTATNTVSGNAAIPFTGLFYAPNGGLKISGNATSGSTGCSEVITSSLTITGNMDLASNCSNYGLTTFGSIPNTTSIGLVQ